MVRVLEIFVYSSKDEMTNYFEIHRTVTICITPSLLDQEKPFQILYIYVTKPPITHHYIVLAITYKFSQKLY